MRAVVLLCLFLFSGFIVPAQNADISLLRKINVGRKEHLDASFRLLTKTVTPVAIGVPMVLFACGKVKNDSCLKQAAIYTGFSALAAGVISTGLKHTINRVRPFDAYRDIQPATTADSPSFPSGHTSAAFSSATSLSIAFPKWYVITVSYGWAMAVGYSRMHLGVHYPSDVLAGALVGAGSAVLTQSVQHWLRRNGSKPLNNNF